MSLDEAFAPAEAAYRAKILAVTWGHLAPIAGKKYKGTIVFGEGDYGEVFILFDNMTVPSSPWWYDHLREFVDANLPYNEGSALYRFTGTYVCNKKGQSRFDGHIERILVAKEENK